MAFDNANQFQRSVRILGWYGCITSLAIVTLFPFHVGRNEFEKRGWYRIYIVCAKMGATKKLGEISIPGNSTITTGLTKVPCVSNIFWEAENFVLYVRVECRLCLSSGGILFFFFFFLG